MNVRLENDVNLPIWRQSMGHPLENVLQHLPFTTIKIKLVACNVCQFSKQTKQPFPIITSISDEIFDLLHMDI